jgi:hypothetical protein
VQIEQISLLASLLIALAPWHIQLSRIAHDAGYGLLTQFLALATLFLGLRLRNSKIVYLAAFFFGLTFYAYHGPRLTSPFLVLLIILVWRKKYLRYLIISFCIFALVVAPIVFDFVSKPLGQTRFGGINIFVRDPDKPFNLILIPVKFITNYFLQLSPGYLFFDASGTRYFNVARVGLMYEILLPFVFVGIYVSSKISPPLRNFLLGTVLISVLPGALTSGPPNAGRNMLLLPILEILAALGIWKCLHYAYRRRFSQFYQVVGISIYALSLLLFLAHYYTLDPNVFWQQWQWPQKKITQDILSLETSANRIIVSESLKQEYIYILYYGAKSPLWLKNDTNKQRASFIGFSAFDKYEFRPINWKQDRLLKNSLLIGTVNEIPIEAANKIYTSPDSRSQFYLVRTPVY